MMAQRLKPLPGMRETWVQSLGWEDPLEKEMITHSSTLVWKIPWTEEPGRLQSMGLVAKSQKRLSDFTFSLLSCEQKGREINWLKEALLLNHSTAGGVTFSLKELLVIP